MPTTGTNAELTNTTGKIHVNEAACTASTCFSDRPMQAEIHENVKPDRHHQHDDAERVEKPVLEPEARPGSRSRSRSRAGASS